MKSSKKRRARRTSKQRSAELRTAETTFTVAEEAFFAAGVEASETGQFETITDETEPPRPGLLKRILRRVQRS
ncbi:MAG: hypothetical protein SFX73_06540 [Kofleriaceae bacterium]|nr:hypothetical protein [Kofleriaceae bacterium]